MKLQELTLSDLPPEIVARVLELSDEACTRRLGETSRFFREVASRYAYQVRVLSIHGHEGLIVVLELGPHVLGALHRLG